MRLLASLCLLLIAPAIQHCFICQLEDLGTETALAFQSQSIDEYPVWSPDSKWIAINVEGRWGKLGLDELSLKKATWHGAAVARVQKQSSLVPMPQSELSRWQQQSRHDPRALKLPQGGTLELSQNGTSTSFVFTDAAGNKTTLWRSDIENCFELSLSPDEQYVAYVCELNGLVVSDIHKLISR